MGCIHLSFDDFCRCTPSEFESICEAYHDQREADYKDGWERARAIIVATLRPHLKGRPTARKVYPLPWDKPKAPQKKAPKPLTAEESKARFEKLVARVMNADNGEDK